MRTVLLLILILPGCARPEVPSASGKAMTARLLAALIETSANSRQAGLDGARAQAAADSVLRSASVTREEFLAGVHALNRDATQWREVSEEATRILEQRLAARSTGR